MHEALHKLSHLLITFPVVALPLTAFGVNSVTGETVAAREAVRVLARAQAANAKCRHLPVPVQEELSGYAIKAELSAARSRPASEVKAAMKAGRAEGEAKPCDAATKADIDDTLAAAREAVVIDPQEPSRPVKKAERQAKVPVRSQATLKRYARMARPYFIEKRCRHLGRSQQSMYWKKIVHLHRAAVSESGTSAATAVMLRAEREAEGPGCGQATLVTVTKGFAELTGQ